MKNFQEFLNKLLSSPSSKTKFSIRGELKRLKGMARFRTVNMPNDEYIKITFFDGSFLLIMPNDEEIYYADEVVEHIKEIKDKDIGTKKLISYKGKEYQLENRDDYQFVINRHVGSHNDIEGEARFSDYFPTSGPQEFLSLGWLSYTGKRADINPVIIDLSEVELL
jgi:hypothetical protein